MWTECTELYRMAGCFYQAKYFQASQPCKCISALILFMTEYIPLYGHISSYASISRVGGHLDYFYFLAIIKLLSKSQILWA